LFGGVSLLIYNPARQPTNEDSMSAEITPELLGRINNAYFTWFTTVRADGMPQPTPVWFIRDGEDFIIYSMPDAQKLKNIRQNSKVALSFADDHEGEEYAVVMGEAAIVEDVPPVHQNPPYVAKYGGGIQRLGWTPEQMAGMFSTVIRVTTTQVRGE
jgi:PPOX class probable F420-dependent enzyme